MSTRGIISIRDKAEQRDASTLLKQYGCGPISYIGDDGLYDRHLLFDNLDSPEDIVEWQTAYAVPGATYRVGPRSVVVLWACAGDGAF